MGDGVADDGLDLDGLVRAALVTVHGTNGEPRGSGFFVAPGLVLTAGHVIYGRADKALEVRFPGGFSRAEVMWSIQDEDGLDLALLRLVEPLEHPCVRLSDRRLGPGDALWAYGFSMRSETTAHTMWNGTFSYQGREGSAWRMTGDTLPMGSSGGPVVDPVGGGVCAVVTAKHTSVPGGLASPSPPSRRPAIPRTPNACASCGPSTTNTICAASTIRRCRRTRNLDGREHGRP